MRRRKVRQGNRPPAARHCFRILLCSQDRLLLDHLDSELSDLQALPSESAHLANVRTTVLADSAVLPRRETTQDELAGARQTGGACATSFLKRIARLADMRA